MGERGREWRMEGEGKRVERIGGGIWMGGSELILTCTSMYIEVIRFNRAPFKFFCYIGSG